jgi:hypothetical protein
VLVISTRTRRSKRCKALCAELQFTPEDIREIEIGGIEKLVTHQRQLPADGFDDGAV